MVIAMFPSKRHHWPAAFVLIAIGVPLLAFIAYENGVWVMLACLVAAGSVLRWPVIYLFRWIKRKVRGDAA